MAGLKEINLARPCITSQTIMNFSLSFKVIHLMVVRRLLPIYQGNSSVTANHMQHKEDLWTKQISKVIRI